MAHVTHQISDSGVSVQYRSAVQVAADVIRHRVYSGQLEPGTAVRIKDLSVEMALSTTPVREALQILEREGLVRIAARSGVHVRSISVDEILEVYAIKQALEPLTIRWALLRSSDAELRTLVDTARKLASLARDERLDEYVELVEGRQRTLLALARSEVLAGIFQTIDGRVRLMRYRNLTQPGRMRRSSFEHQQLARAIEQRDVELASELSARYVRSATQSLIAVIRKSGDSEISHNPLSWPTQDGSGPDPRPERAVRGIRRRKVGAPVGARRRRAQPPVASSSKG